jgi:hypothetical protein
VVEVEGTHRELGYADVAKAQVQVELNRTSAELED